MCVVGACLHKRMFVWECVVARVWDTGEPVYLSLIRVGGSRVRLCV